MKNKNGFTLVELVSVIAIIGVVVILVMSGLLNTFRKSEHMIDDYTKQNLLDAAKMYLMDLDKSVETYTAPSDIEVNGKTYAKGSILSTYDLRVYLIEHGLTVNTRFLVENKYYNDEGCDYSKTPNTCDVKENCTMKIWIVGGKSQNDLYYVSNSYEAEILDGCD